MLDQIIAIISLSKADKLWYVVSTNDKRGIAESLSFISFEIISIDVMQRFT